jgi:hypothetical protein
MVGERQTIETLISEEARLLAKYLRDEIPTWNPRIINIYNKTEKVTSQHKDNYG